MLKKHFHFAHKDRLARVLFSGISTIDARLTVTASGTPLRRRLENLKLRHHVYLRIVGRAVHVLGDAPASVLQMPASVASRKPEKFCHDQRKALEAAFSLIGPRPTATTQDRKKFLRAT